MTRRPILVFAVLAVMAGGMAACSSGGKGSAGASPGASGRTQRVLDIGRRFSQCARQHGYPNFPDPEIDRGELSFPGGADIKPQVAKVLEVPECKAIMNESLTLDNRNSTPTPSAADLAKMRRFAQCMREHGIPEFPDPKADGTFPIIGTPLENAGGSARVMSALDACKGIWNGKLIPS
jgi:hypothetical protein